MKQIDLVNYLKEIFESVEGVKALYLKGSLARDEEDEYSDVDFYCLVAEDKYENIKLIREKMLSGYNEIYFMEEVNFGLEQLVVIYSNNLHLDFYLTTEIPSKGTDELKSVYDPDGLLDDYIRLVRTDSIDNVIDSLNQSIYTFSEVYAAIKRDDAMWSIRLLSHILAILATPMSFLYDKGNPVIHMKGLYDELPGEIKEDVDSIMNLMIPETQIECALKLIELNEQLVKILGEDIKTKLPIKYLELMKKTISEV